jgi:hypothetical protein
MARIAMNRRTPLAVRARLLAELAQYVYPKRRAIDHSSSDQSMSPQWIVKEYTPKA